MKKRTMLSIGLLTGISLLHVSCSVFGIRSEETPTFEVLLSDGNKEIRAYSAYVVAKTTVKGDFKDAQGEAFRILAGYIFGDNEKKQKISMTAPVVQKTTAAHEKLAMTAPVVQSPAKDGWMMTFMMPSKYTLADLPTPKDKRVQFEEIPAKIFGVIRYSGLGRQSTNTAMAHELRVWLMANGRYEVVSGPSYARYDPPWTIPLFRRNEMMYELKPSKSY